MKKFVLTVFAVLMVATSAAAQVGDISIYSDGAGLSCNITDASPSLLSLFVIHKHTVGATASQFGVSLTGGSTMTFTGATAASGMLLLGTPPTDISIAYGGCVAGDFLIANVTYFGGGSSPACSGIRFDASPFSPIAGEVALVECDFETVSVVPTGQAIINPDVTCQCSTAVNTTTWGAVKALYR